MEDLKMQARAAAAGLLDTLQSMPEVQALYVLSSSAVAPNNVTRFSTDSDFDLAVVLDVPLKEDEWRPSPADTYALVRERLPAWVPEFSFYLPVPWGRMEVNVHQLLFQYEADPRTTWNSDKCDAYANKGEPLLDRENAFEALIFRKTKEQLWRLEGETRRLHNRITWDVREIPLRMARRVGTPTGHFVLSGALDEIVDWLYARSGRLLPNMKWKLHSLGALGLISTEQENLLIEAQQCDPLSMVDLERRCEALEAFCRSAGMDLSTRAIETVRKAYQRANHHILGEHASVFVDRPFPRFVS
ncbi:hypothetical protein [Streptomyces sp. AP-93]|uniref:hypothetical protein n=1 Tax=Streptomyces sp. AP-93 TaxID=2929048 RepID=UPI001FAFC756|nr:hypothetical protein [Streptomyces sp. AP-93]MCJ0868442.1 hypothetical protein [Streptomyces sp. AP-93]